MGEFIRFLTSTLGRPVVDETGVTTHFDIHFEFAVDDTTGGSTKEWANVQGHREMMAESAAAATDGQGASPNILVAVQQLGLKLDISKGPVDVMVIDRVERPAGN